jgi:hypothetical protein
MSSGSAAFAQDVPPPLGGESFHQDLPTITSVDCREITSFTYLATGTATGPYPGTFTETGAVTFNQLSASFTIDSPIGRVTGTTSGNVGVSCASGAFCEGAAACEGEAVAFNGGGTYEATITTADGSFRNTGLIDLALFRSHPGSPLNHFDESFAGSSPPVPLAPTSKGQCKHGGWKQFDLKNQGQCVAFVRRGTKP